MLKQENTPRLETERLILRKFQHDDLEDVFRIYSDLEVNTFLPWFPLRSMDEARAYLAHTILPEYEKKIAYRYAIVEKTSQTVIGYVSLNGIDEGKCCADLGYGLRKEALAQGLYERSMPRRIAARKGGGVPFSHRHARCEQPGERRGHEGDRHDLPIFLRRAVAAQEF